MEQKKEEENKQKKQNNSAEDEHKRTVKIDAIITVSIDSITSLIKNRPSQTAASMAYFALFSIFPLFILMIGILGVFGDTSVIQQKATDFLKGILPGAEQLILINIKNVFSNQTLTSILSALSLVWSGSGFFSSVVKNIQYAYPETRGRGYFINRFFSFVMIILLILIVAAAMVFTLVFNLSDALAYFNIQINSTIRILIKIVSSYVIPIVLLYIVGFLLYYYVPSVHVDRKAARAGAAVFSISWRVYTLIFSLYVLSPMNRYNIIYGSVGAIIILLFYIYTGSFLLLYPAHLVAAITHYKERQALLKIKHQNENAPINTNLAVTNPGIPAQDDQTAKKEPAKSEKKEKDTFRKPQKKQRKPRENLFIRIRRNFNQNISVPTASFFNDKKNKAVLRQQRISGNIRKHTDSIRENLSTNVKDGMNNVSDLKDNIQDGYENLKDNMSTMKDNITLTGETKSAQFKSAAMQIIKDLFRWK